MGSLFYIFWSSLLDIHLNQSIVIVMNLQQIFFLALLPLLAKGGQRLPEKMLGMYVNLADNWLPEYADESDWTPQLYPYQQTGANVLFFTFIDPRKMVVPLAFRKLAKSRGHDTDGAVPSNTTIIFAIGGYEYSLNPNPWTWLESREAAEEMALQVAHWKQYGADGIDLDLETGAGDQPAAGVNMFFFIEKLRSYVPDFIITQPTFGYPQIPANNFVINNSWDVDGKSKNVADTVGLMVYEGAGSLDYVKNYAEATSQWEGFPIRVNVPRSSILVGSRGSASAEDINTLAEGVVEQDLLGIMVWYCSVQNGFQYEADWDCSESEESQEALQSALTSISSGR